MENQFSFELCELHDNPFSRTAGASYPYLSSSFREALAALYYGLEYGSRILMLSANRGLGKTTLLRHFERRVQDRGSALFLSPSQDNGSEVLGKLLDAIGGTAAGDDLLATRVQVDEILTGAADNPFILLLDYDQDAEQSAPETLRRLRRLESFEKGLLRVVIAGSSELAERLQGSEFAAEIRRVPLAPLTAAEVETYIDYRLRLVGWRGDRLFTAKACALIAERSSANPSAINEICFNLLQNLAERESLRSDRASRNKDYILDEYCVDSVLSGREPLIPVPAHSVNRRAAALAGVVLMLVLAVAGLWYRSAIKARAAKHVTAEITVPLTAPFHSDVIRDARPNRLTNPAHEVTVTATGAVGESVAGNSATEAGKTATYDMVAGRATTAVRPLLKSPTTAALNNTGDHPAKTVAKKEHEVVTAPLSTIVLSRRPPTSSPVPSETAVNHTAAARRVTVAARGVSNATRTAEEVAAFEIRLGDVYMNLGDYDKALGRFSRAIAFAPDNKQAEEKVKRAHRAKAAEENILQ